MEKNNILFPNIVIKNCFLFMYCTYTFYIYVCIDYTYIYMCKYTFINMYMVNYVEYRGVYWIFMKTRRTVFNNYSKRFNQLFITI